MKALKIILGIIVVLFFLYILASFFTPDRVYVQRSEVIGAPPEVVFEQVSDFKTWPEWSYWSQLDTAAEYVYEGETGKVGSSYSWEGEKVGQGTQAITAIKPYEFIDTELDFMEQGTAMARWEFEPVDGDSTKVNWNFETDLSFFERVFPGWFMEKFIGPAYEKSLTNLKELSESMPEESETATTDITTTMLESQWHITKRVDTTIEQLNAVFGNVMGEVGTYIRNKNLQLAGQPMAIFHEYAPEEDFVDMEIGFPVPDSVGVGEGMNLTALGGKVVTTTHYGSYETSGETYNKLMSWMKEKGIQPMGPPWETYIIYPGNEPDTTKWQTEIYFPVGQ